MRTLNIASQETRALNKQDYKTLALSSLGGALEFYDFIIFLFFSVTIGKLFFPSDMPAWLSQVQTVGIFAAGYLIRPFGGIVMAHFGDLFGRKKMFTLSILLMSLPTFLIGCLPTYATLYYAAPILLLLMRLCQGLAVGGEVPGAWTFVAEHVPRDRIGVACGILTSGLSLGILFGSLMSTFIHSLFQGEAMETWGWRVPFIIGGLFGLLSMYLRRWLQETPIFIEMQQRKSKEAVKRLPVLTVLLNYLPQTILCMLLTWILSAGILVVVLMAPIYLQQQFAFTPLEALNANTLAIIGLIISCTMYGILVDKFAFHKVLFIGCLVAAITVGIFYFSLEKNSSQLFITYPLAGFGVGVVGCFSYFMVRVFPTEIRYSGVSFSFNMAYALAGGFTPVLLSIFTNFFNKLASGFYVVSLFILGVIIALLLFINKRGYFPKEIN